MVTKNWINCENCPCLNNDCEMGGICNLGYSADLYWFDKNGNQVKDTPEMRSHQKDFDLFYASDDCELIEIKCKDQTFYPSRITPVQSGQGD